MDHDEVALGGDEVLDLANLSCGAVIAGDDGNLAAVCFNDILESGHNAGPVSILQGLNGDADLFAA